MKKATSIVVEKYDVGVESQIKAKSKSHAERILNDTLKDSGISYKIEKIEIECDNDEFFDYYDHYKWYSLYLKVNNVYAKNAREAEKKVLNILKDYNSDNLLAESIKFDRVYNIYFYESKLMEEKK